MRLAPGTRLGDYELQALLGSGGMGEVYRARDLRLRRDVAVKVISSSFASEADALARFRREAEAASMLNHPHIVTVHDFGEAALPDGTSVNYLVSELIDGRTLREMIHDPAVTRRELLVACEQVAEGLAKAHGAGIVHRDLKPDNIMVSRDGYAKIVDFGLAKLHEPRPSVDDAQATEKLRSQSGAVIGTVGYMAPEQVRGRPADTRSDIFAFGCILYEALTRRQPFAGESQFDALSKIVFNEPPPLRESWPEAPEDVERIVRRCLEKSPEDRFQSARDLAIDLRQSIASGVAPHPALTRGGGVGGARLLVIGAVLLVLIAAAILIRNARATKPRGIESLVILPFTNAGRDPELEYLSDGVTDALLNDVSRMPRMRVIARTTAFRYKNTPKELPAIGRELGVEGIVAGQVRRSGNRLLVDAELVDVKDGTRVWGRHYENASSDMLRVERDIVGALAGALQGSGTALPRQATESREAYDLYLKGRYFWNKRTRESVAKALDLFQKAIDADPTYARAYSGVSDCYIALAQLGGAPRAQACERGLAAAQRAVELDESIPEAHTSLGYIDLSCQLDLKAADREFRRAIALSPTYAQAHHWYGLYLTNLGRAAEGLPQVREAARLDPFSTQIQGNLAYATYYSGNAKEAMRIAQEANELDRNAPYPYHMRGYLALATGDYKTAIESLRQAADRGLAVSLPFLAYACARSGDAAAARRTLEEIEHQPNDAARTPALLAGPTPPSATASAPSSCSIKHTRSTTSGSPSCTSRRRSIPSEATRNSRRW